MRKILSDGTNSIAHLLVGLVGVYYPIVLILGVLYQLNQQGTNMKVDLLEYGIGFGLETFLSRLK